jgi:hypothetical protein
MIVRICLRFKKSFGEIGKKNERTNRSNIGISWLDEIDIPVEGVLPTPSVAIDDER